MAYMCTRRRELNVPEGKDVSSEVSQMESDPMSQDDFGVRGDVGFVQLPTPRRFRITCAGFFPLVDVVYSELTAVHGGYFGSDVSRSAFRYYATIHLWARLAMIMAKHGRSTEDGNNLIKFCDGSPLNSNGVICKTTPLPEPILRFLRSIGDLVDQNGIENELDLPYWPTSAAAGPSTGWFGRIDADVHNAYETFPAPGVAATLLCKDLAYTTTDKTMDVNWQLPDEILPQDRNGAYIGGLPTPNLLGWAPASKLTSNQVLLLQNSGITSDRARTTGSFGLNENLIGRVATYLIETGRSYKMDDRPRGFRITSHGSQGQMAFVTRDVTDHLQAQNESYVAGALRSECLVRLDQRFSVGTILFCLRMKRGPVQNRHAWCCMEFDDYTKVPEDWIATVNNDFAVSTVWNTATVATAYTRRERLMGHYVRSAVINKS